MRVVRLPAEVLSALSNEQLAAILKLLNSEPEKEEKPMLKREVVRGDELPKTVPEPVWPGVLWGSFLISTLLGLLIWIGVIIHDGGKMIGRGELLDEQRYDLHFTHTVGRLQVMHADLTNYARYVNVVGYSDGMVLNPVEKFKGKVRSLIIRDGR